MGFLKSLFGPSKAEIWSQVAQEIGGQFDEGGFFGKDALRYQHGEWEIVLDTYTRSSGTGNNRSTTTYTRMRAPFVNKDGFYFEIYREGIFSALGRIFGLQDIIIGDPMFDDQFVIKSNSEEKVRWLFDDQGLKNLIHQVPQIHLTVRDDEGWFGERFPQGTDELYFSCAGTIRDVELLKTLFELFAATLNRLVAIDSAYEHDPQVRLN